MNKLRAIIADDEESARDVLQNLLLRFCPEVEVIGKCENVLSAVEMIHKEHPDLVFLDIEMPNYAGYEIVNFFKAIDFEIIFVTAYDQYAIRAFEISAIDYLLKPVDIERLKLAVAKVRRQRNIEQQAQRLSLLSNTLETKQLKNIVVTDKGQQHIIPVKNIVAVEAQESYCILHTTEKQHVASKNLKHFEKVVETLPQFIRVHKSWLINKEHLKHYSKSDLSIQLSNGLTAKLSKYKKAEFEASVSA
ncbi:MAG: response regulator [Bacteroidia bacterium]|nr:response regulator [Bacteroidia bacterium]